MKIQFEKNDDVTIIHPLDARMDAVSTPEFARQVMQQIDSGNKQLVLNMHKVNFVDSTGLGAIVSVFKAVAPDGKLILTSITGMVKDLFEITRIDQVINIVETEQEAIELAK
jgi:anti-sigma B factor antagonist